ncbi:MAG: TRAP transporter fused permease subunit, partial [Burkholderiaceae bacterium]
MATDIEKAPEALQQLVADSDTGGRKPTGVTAGVIFAVSLFWALYQLWYASPLPFALGFGILNDTEARSLHLGLALFLAFTAWPAFKRSPRAYVPALDWLLALAAAFAGAYLLLFYKELATRPGQPTPMDIVVACAGLVLLLEATRRSVGWPMAVLAALFIAYAMLGPWMPDVLSHKGASLNRMLSHMWLTTEGVFGIALGVSSSTIFVYVMFGTLLDRAGGGNYMMQMSFAALGHLRGGPAKVAVVSSALNGMISGSSVSNVVSGGIFTIPLMKKAGYGGIKAGAIETMSSVNGQIMPPVMGAAAFLMVEYVGIPYSDIVKHAILPATLSYIGLLYIVHLEALKLGMQPVVTRAARPLRDKLLRFALGLSGTAVVCGALYYLLQGINAALGAAAPWAVGAVVLALYGIGLHQVARCPDLPEDIDIDSPVALDTWPTVRAGLHFM